MATISRVRHQTKYGCLKLCIDKEKQGFECVSPITKKVNYQKHFKRSGKFVDFAYTNEDIYYEAVYRRKFIEKRDKKGWK